MNDIQEIEVKARVANFDLLLQRLSDLGCKISLPITQNDTVYLPNNVTFSDISFVLLNQHSVFPLPGQYIGLSLVTLISALEGIC